MTEFIDCSCGCGEKIPKVNSRGQQARYKYNHHQRNVKRIISEETKERMSAAMKDAWPERRLKRLLKDNPSQYGKLGFKELLQDSIELLKAKVVSV